VRRHSILPEDWRRAIFDPPQTHEEAQIRFALSQADIDNALSRRWSRNKLGFVLQLALVRDLGRPLRRGETISPAALPPVSYTTSGDTIRCRSSN